MQKEKWLCNLIFDTALIDYVTLSDEEKIIIRKYLEGNETPGEIAGKNKRPVYEVDKISKTAMEKVLISSKELFAKKI